MKFGYFTILFYKNNILAKLLNALKTKGVRNEQGVNLQNMSFWE